MRDPIVITSLQNPRVKAIVKLRDQRGRKTAQRFIAEGMRAVRRAVEAGVEVESFWVCGALLEAGGGMIPTYAAHGWGVGGDVEVVHVSEAVFKKIAYVREPEGVLAVCVPPGKRLSDAMPDAGKHTIDLVVVGSEKPGNLGAMIRTADLAGCRRVVTAGAPVDPWNPNAIRASTGAVFTMPVVEVPEDMAIKTLIGEGIRVVAAVVDGHVEHTQVDFTAGPCAIVIGPEDQGLSEPWRVAAEQTGGACVGIPMAGQTADSFNASVAAGILLFEAVRQLRAAGLQ